MQREDFSKDGRGTPPTTPQSLIDELEDAVNKSDMRRRATTLRRLTDLFIVNGSGFSEQQIAMFDEVMSRLVIAIDSSARAEFGDLIAKHPNAPPRTSRVLALDDEIKVAGPILSHSRQFDDATLIEGAKTKSRNHLYAISQRELIGEAVTDVLVERGNEEVVRSTAANPGAQFPSTAARRLRRAPKVTANWRFASGYVPTFRGSIFCACSAASENVQKQLEGAERQKVELYRYMVAQAKGQLQTKMREASSGYATARR